jgi:hypothetical protein
MNWLSGRKTAVRLGIAILAVVACWLTGCGKEEKPAPVAAAEVKGEPIRGEPIAQAPVAPKATTPLAEPAPLTPEAPALAIPATPTAATVAATTPTPDLPAPGTTATTAKPQAAETLSGAKAPAAAVGTGTAESPLVVGFDKLASFKYDLPDGQVDTNTVAQTGAAQQIPAPIKALNNQFISLKGFMLPLKVEKGLVTELLMMRDQSMCCYGSVPRINEWVSVKMVGVGVKPIMDQAVTLFGKLKVGEMYENGYLVGIYSLDGERMSGPLDM